MSGETKEQPPRLLRSSFTVSLMTMISRVLGLARDIVFAVYIGAAGGADAFFVAFKIPNFLRRLFAEGAFAQAFVPVLSEYRAGGNRALVRHFIDRIAGCLGVSVISLSALAVLAAPALTFLFAPGFYWQAPEKYELTTAMIRITFPYLALISLAGFAGAILNSYDRFAIPAVTPVLLNIVLIAFAVLISPKLAQPVMALAWGVLVAGICQLAFQLPFLMRLDLLPRPRVDWRDESVLKVLKLMAPAMFAVSVSQINLLLDTVIASFIADGSVSWLYYSDRLIELPLGVFGIAIATVVLPTLSRQHAAAHGSYHETLDWALRSILLVALPAAAALVILAQPIIITLFQHGDRFSPLDAQMASLSLRAYAVGLTGFMLIKVLVTGYFSRQDTRTPTRIGVIAMAANMVFNLLLAIPLHVFWQVGHVGLALATSASAFVNAWLLWRGLTRRGDYRPGTGWGVFFARAGIACVAMILALVAGLGLAPAFIELVWWRQLGWLSGLCAGGLAVYIACLWLLGVRVGHLRPQAPQ